MTLLISSDIRIARKQRAHARAIERANADEKLALLKSTAATYIEVAREHDFTEFKQKFRLFRRILVQPIGKVGRASFSRTLLEIERKAQILILGLETSYSSRQLSYPAMAEEATVYIDNQGRFYLKTPNWFVRLNDNDLRTELGETITNMLMR